MGFKRHLTPRLINKNSATFDDSTEWILIRSVSLIPSWVAPQQSPGPFLLTCKDKKYNLTQFIVHSQLELNCIRFIRRHSRFSRKQLQFFQKRSQLNLTRTQFNLTRSQFTRTRTQFNPGRTQFNRKQSQFTPTRSQFNRKQSQFILTRIRFTGIRSQFTWITLCRFNPKLTSHPQLIPGNKQDR